MRVRLAKFPPDASNRRLIRELVWVVTGLARGLARAPFRPRLYEIKRGYRARSEYRHFNAQGATDQGQREVYEAARDLMRRHDLDSVLDVGCGSGYKLVHLLGDYTTVGLDLPANLSYLSEAHPDRRWLDATAVDFSDLQADLVICADVIEHVVDPDALMRSLVAINDVRYFVLSTPERNLCRGLLHFGPPGNPTHQREWSSREFRRYVGCFLEIESHQISSREQGTQMIIATPKKQSGAWCRPS